MNHLLHQVAGDIVSPSDLKISKARDLALRLEADSIDNASLVECRRDGLLETIVFDVKIEVPQIKANDILSQERIAVAFSSADNVFPEVQALRLGFPRVPHINLRETEYPRSLCLYEDRYEDVKRTWTSMRFINRIQQWLSSTAKGELHQNDQVLEPFILSNAGYIVLPSDISHFNAVSERLYIIANVPSDRHRYFLIARRDKIGTKALPFIVSPLKCPPVVHGIISKCPTTIAGLVDLFKPLGLDILKELRDLLTACFHQITEDATLLTLLDHILVLLITIPQKRNEDGQEEKNDARAFIIADNIYLIGEKLGIWKREFIDRVKDKQHIVTPRAKPKVDGPDLALIIGEDPWKTGDDISVKVLNVLYSLSDSAAAHCNGKDQTYNPTIVAIGMGALGSQVVMNLARRGFGTWTLIDFDLLMPHNVARHALYSFNIGSNKAESVACLANQIVLEKTLYSALSVDVLSSESETELRGPFKAADAIIDMSTSVTVARKLSCDLDSKARRLSLFLTPTGQDLVLLVEDRDREIFLDALEMQYYRSILHEGLLEGHLMPPEGHHRYGQSCRDITFQLAQNLVALHAAIGAGAIESALNGQKAMISIWRSALNGSVKRIDIPVENVIRHRIGNWTLVTDGGLLRKLHELRRLKLNNETGGVLIGDFDTEKKILYIVDTLPSPPDSEEWPTLYIRGCKGLQQNVNEMTRRVGEMLRYVGEWHSHPRRASTSPSSDDKQVFSWLSELMEIEGLPATMMIVGDRGNISCFVAEMKRNKSLLPGLKSNGKNLA